MSTPNPSQDAATNKARVIYEQNNQSFRQLNTFMWQVPILAMTLTGGIWFGISKVGEDKLITVALYVLVAIANFGFICVLWRVRAGVMERLLAAMREFDGMPASSGYKYLVITIFSIILFIATVISVGGAWTTYHSDPTQHADAKRMIVEDDGAGVRVHCE